MESRAWVDRAVRIVHADFVRSADTHLIRLDIPAVPSVHFYLKDESVHPTGSLKHRLARSLFLYALCNGWLTEGATVIEASSGNTAVSEAYFARLLGLPFVAVMPQGTSTDKLRQIEFYGGRCHLTAPGEDTSDVSRRLAAECGGHFMDQFTYAERATDWRGNNNVAESTFAQLQAEPHPVPTWVVCSAGTGGTSATFGRYARYQNLPTRICLADPENSVYAEAWRTGRRDVTCVAKPGVEGIGRPRVEPSFIAGVIDRCERVPNAASFGAMHFLAGRLGRRCGGSTGTNLYAAATLINEMIARGESGSIVILICDTGERYLNSYYDPEWLTANDYDIIPYITEMERLFNGTGEGVPTLPSKPIMR